MKKTYFAPVAKTIDLITEESILLTVSGEPGGNGTDTWGDSNRREENYSSPIWDNEI